MRIARARIANLDEPPPCGLWPIDPSCCPGWPEDPADWNDMHRWAVQYASAYLYAASGHQYGLCPVTVRPCLRPCTPQYAGSYYGMGGWGVLNPYPTADGNFRNLACGCRPDGCDCSRRCAVDLPGPVHEILEVRLDGKVITTWRLSYDKGRAELIRTSGTDVVPPLDLVVREDRSDGTGMTAIAYTDNAGYGDVRLDFGDGTTPLIVPERTDIPHKYGRPGTFEVESSAPDVIPPETGEDACWPHCQDMDKPDTEVGTMSVTYLQGREVPFLGRAAAGWLACQKFKDCAQDGECEFPEGWQRVVREGLTIEALTAEEQADLSRTPVGAFLRLVNPSGRRYQPRVYTPDLPRQPKPMPAVWPRNTA